MPIEIVHTKTDTIIETVDPDGLKSDMDLADIDAGFKARINRNEFHTRIVSADQPETANTRHRDEGS